jgi:hypothetical protein
LLLGRNLSRDEEKGGNKRVGDGKREQLNLVGEDRQGCIEELNEYSRVLNHN